MIHAEYLTWADWPWLIVVIVTVAVVSSPYWLMVLDERRSRKEAARHWAVKP